MAGVLRINPLPLTLRQLQTMYLAHQAETWEHTVAILNCWSKRPIHNPYRRRRRSRGMSPAELYALGKALDKRNAKRAN